MNNGRIVTTIVKCTTIKPVNGHFQPDGRNYDSGSDFQSASRYTPQLILGSRSKGGALDGRTDGDCKGKGKTRT